MNSIVTAQKKRPENSAGSAWLRGGQTIAHTFDMIVELWRKLRWILLLWAALCWAIADGAAPDKDQVYAGLHLVAWCYRTIGTPLPQTLSVTDPSGATHAVSATAYDSLPYVRTAIDTYFGYMWRGLWLWVLGTLAMLSLMSYAFIRSGDEKLESHDIRGQQIVPLRILFGLIGQYNLEKAREINHETLRALGLPSATGAGDWLHRRYVAIREMLARAKDIIRLVHHRDGVQPRPHARPAPDPAELLRDGERFDRLRAQLKSDTDLAHAIVNEARWAKGTLEERNELAEASGERHAVVVDYAVATGRAFIKPLRYNLGAGRALAAALFTDGPRKPTAFYIVRPDETDVLTMVRQELIDSGRTATVLWDLSENPIPSDLIDAIGVGHDIRGCAEFLLEST